MHSIRNNLLRSLLKIKTLTLRLQQFLFLTSSRIAVGEEVLKSELLNTEQMAHYARTLAGKHKLSSHLGPDRLLSRLADNEVQIHKVYQQLVSAVKKTQLITPASEWLLDNFHLIEEHIVIAKRHLPRGYSRSLPRLQKGPSDSLPRVYDIALEIISHSDANLNKEMLKLCISSYQKVAPLKLGELWAIPIMLRLALIENLRRVSIRILRSRTNRDLADFWATQMIATAEKAPADLILVISDMARSNPPLEGGFVAELVRRLQGHGSALALPLTWVEQRLTQLGASTAQMIYNETRQQASDQVSIRNSIGSLRFLNKMDWRTFVEEMSLVEHILITDPARMYHRMDFATRDLYRHSVEKISRYSRLTEEEVAQAALALALEGGGADATGAGQRPGHVGYYLVDKGLQKLEQRAQMRVPLPERVSRVVKSRPLLTYLGSIGLLTGIFCFGLCLVAYRTGMQPAVVGVLAVAAFFSASHLAVGLVNWLATMLARPHHMPRLDFSKGVPEDFRTLIAVPTMIGSLQGVDALTEGLEVRFLANRSADVQFCLLTDFGDATAETLPADQALLGHAQRNIDALNRKYAAGGRNIFFLMHRPRLWNAQEKMWMAYERKRGKLGALNAFLLTGDASAFMLFAGKKEDLSGIRYVITLDTDTQLPRDAAHQMAGVMAHPLNRARYDEVAGRVTEGYGIVQPRVAVSLPGTDASLYARLCGGEPGIDPYTRAISDVYQDAFQEGSFIGKGIYDVSAFEHALKDRFPENRILSHDLIEGCYTRSGLLSDVQLYEEYPSGYLADARRRHRWVRGDWQIARWMTGTVPGGDGGLVKNPLSLLARWKIFDNLRRSLVPQSMLLMLALGWSCTSLPLVWTQAVIGILVIPSLGACLYDFTRKARDVTWRRHITSTLHASGRHLGNAGVVLLCLPYEAYYQTDAILRAMWRMLVSKTRLLEWNPSSITNGSRNGGLADAFRNFWVAPAFALAFALLLMKSGMPALLAGAPFLALWCAFPAIAWKLSQSTQPRVPYLSAEQHRFLGRLARKIWNFFEVHVGPQDNWLPPDNMQEEPVAVVAHRTSPTNMGLALLANLTAHDFGYISLGTLLTRTANTLHTMQRLERYQGHFYNWYDTLSLVPLHPTYVSTVDSGNLAGHLLTLEPGLAGLVDQPVLSARIFSGLRDTLDLMAEADSAAPTENSLLPFKFPEPPPGSPQTLTAAREYLEALADEVHKICAGQKPSDSDVAYWCAALLHQCEDALADIRLLAPWVFTGSGIAAPDALGRIPRLRELARYESALLPELDRLLQTEISAARKKSIEDMRVLLPAAALQALERITALGELQRLCTEMARMEYDFLYDADSHLFTVGYNVRDRQPDPGFYDLLASEARLATFVAIAQGKIPQESWFALGRQLVNPYGDPSLVSWSGSMFEYLMPLLVMPTFEKTLLDQTLKSAVLAHINYGEETGVPWGVSESGYLMFDAHLNYQYKSFGVPDLGIKRGLAKDIVIAPYASTLALMVFPEEACSNMQRLSAEGFEGRFGLFEAIDYTPARLPRGKNRAIIRSFMAHHQGMSFLALAYFLLDRPMQRRFEANPLFQATMLLLHEKIPKTSTFFSKSSESQHARSALPDIQESSVRVLRSTNASVPEVQLLSNGRYHVMVTNGGGGFSKWNDLSLTRWQEDGTRDNWGVFCYVRDIVSGEVWSAGYHPTLKKSEDYEVVFSEGRADFRRKDNSFEMHTEIVVSPEDDIEVRRCHIKNRSRKRRTIEVTSYAEVALAPAAADAAHPAFSKLFVQTEVLKKRRCIICTRRPRSAAEKPAHMFHQMMARGGDVGQISYETDRMRFIGRRNTLESPAALLDPAPLSGTQGSVLDPIAAIRYQVTLDPGEAASFDIIMGAAETRAACLRLIKKYNDPHIADRVFEMAWTHSQVLLRQINATESDAQVYARLASSIIYPNHSLRADASTIMSNRRGQSGLWSYAISGDFPIVLLQIRDAANIDLVRQLVQAHAYWRLKGLAVDLVIWNDEQTGYHQLLQEQIMDLIAAGIEAHVVDRPGGIFVRPGDQISVEDRVLLESVARIILTDSDGSLAEQVNRAAVKDLSLPRLIPTQPPRQMREETPPLSTPDLLLFNGTGGFSKDGREYTILTGPGRQTPAPWVNVLANPGFGTVVSESGSSYTWNENAHEFRLTPWANDPVIDGGGEAFYIRDEATGEFWSPMPYPVQSGEPYITRHGFGYSKFEHIEKGIHSELCIYVAMDAPVKFSVLKIRNDSGRTRQLSATGYVEWVLGDLRQKTAMHVVTEEDPVTGALFARNAYNTEFPGRIAFFDVDDETRTVTGDRCEFIGRNKSLQQPAAMGQTRLSGKVGAGLDACGALQMNFTLADGEEKEIIFRLGVASRQTSDSLTLARRFSEAGSLIRRFRGSPAARIAIEAVHRHWNDALGAVQVETPDSALNILANGWLMYQTLACRMWARSGYYQSGGAFGFRDQLQDAMALIHTKPLVLREQLLLHAQHQFPEGDVQHWWHPPLGRGVRTKCSDDYLWLPLAACRYVVATGDTGVLDETVPFITGRALNADEDSSYYLPEQSAEQGTLYNHCVRAIQRGLRYGEHGLPLIGSCDWNDGMDKVGIHGKGESVWLGFFLYDVLERFSKLAERRGDAVFAALCLTEAAQLRENIEKNGWDGEWYRRAYFDDGTPLGSAGNAECQIDSLSQSWAVLSGAGDPARAAQAMAMVDARLVKRDTGIVQLLAPPFDKSAQNPGYIRGYVPGVRENGGQYTHAAIWTAMAFAKMGDNARAWELTQMINPLNHALTPKDVQIYKVEPYVIAADVYATRPHEGRGGWTWYTGSSGWMYRLILESLLGVTLKVDRLYCRPCLPPEWKSFSIDYRYRTTMYKIIVTVVGSNPGLTLDGAIQTDDHLQMVDDQLPHTVELRIMPQMAAAS